VDTYQFSVQTGDVVRFRLLRVATSVCPTRIRLLFRHLRRRSGAEQRPFAVNVDPTSKRLSFASLYNFYDWTATVTGTVTVVVFEYTGNLGSSYYVSAPSSTAGAAALLSCNSTVDGVLTSPLTYGSYTIQANGGDVYQFRAARPGTSGGFTPGVEIFDFKGHRWALRGGQRSGPRRRSLHITFPTSGTYSVLVSGPLDGSLGSYSLGTLRLNRPCDGATALSCSSVVDGSVPGLIRNQMYSLSASANDSYMVRLLRPTPTACSGRAWISTIRPAPRCSSSIPTTWRESIHGSGGRPLTLVVTTATTAHRAARTRSPCCASTGVRRRDTELQRASVGSFPRTLASSVYAYTAAAGESFSVRMLPAAAPRDPPSKSTIRWQPGGPAPLRQLRRRRCDQAGSRRLHRGRHRWQQDALRLQFHDRPAAHGQRLFRARCSGRDGEWSSLGHGAVSGVWHRGLERRRARLAQQLFHGRVRLPDGALRSRRARLDTSVFSLSRKAAASGTLYR